MLLLKQKVGAPGSALAASPAPALFSRSRPCLVMLSAANKHPPYLFPPSSSPAFSPRCPIVQFSLLNPVHPAAFTWSICVLLVLIYVWSLHSAVWLFAVLTGLWHVVTTAVSVVSGHCARQLHKFFRDGGNPSILRAHCHCAFSPGVRSPCPYNLLFLIVFPNLFMIKLGSVAYIFAINCLVSVVLCVSSAFISFR